MFHDGNDFGSHEPGRTDGRPRTCDLRDLDYSSGIAHLDTPAGPRRLDLEALDPGPYVDEDLHAVTLHDTRVAIGDAAKPGRPCASARIVQCQPSHGDGRTATGSS
jgi:hypothetical protein